MRNVMRSNRGTLIAAMTVAASSAAYDEQGMAPASIDSEALVAATPGLSVTGLAEGLGLPPQRQTELEADVTSLHASLLELHEMPGRLERVTDDEKRALHEDVHERYEALLGSLTEPQRKILAARIRERMRAHSELDLAAARERHGDAHPEGHGEAHAKAHGEAHPEEHR